MISKVEIQNKLNNRVTNELKLVLRARKHLVKQIIHVSQNTDRFSFLKNGFYTSEFPQSRPDKQRRQSIMAGFSEGMQCIVDAVK